MGRAILLNLNELENGLPALVDFLLVHQTGRGNSKYKCPKTQLQSPVVNLFRAAWPILTAVFRGRIMGAK